MSTLILSHPDCLVHDPGPGHAEQPARLHAVLEALRAPVFAHLRWQQAPIATMEDLLRVHRPDYIHALEAALPVSGFWNVDPDTVLSPGSLVAARRAAGAVCAAVDAVCSGDATTAFCAVRPPGHHAEADQSKGFCLFNNLGVGAARARARHGVRRIAIVDFDAHHGNGAQRLFWDEADTLAASLHQWPLYPGTGAAQETGAHGTILNVPLPAETDGLAFRDAISQLVIPRLIAFQPDLILVAAGFDAHQADPLTNLMLTAEDFQWIGTTLRHVAAMCCGGRLVASLEGGYNLEALAASVAAFISGLDQPAPSPVALPL